MLRSHKLLCCVPLLVSNRLCKASSHLVNTSPSWGWLRLVNSTAWPRCSASAASMCTAASDSPPAGSTAAVSRVAQRRRRVALASSVQAAAETAPAVSVAPPKNASHPASDKSSSTLLEPLTLGGLVRGKLNAAAPQLPAGAEVDDAGLDATTGESPSSAADSLPGLEAGSSAGDGGGDVGGVMQLTGTEQELFAQALGYVPPQAAVELVEVAQLANVHREARSLPAHKMLQAISKVLDLSQRFPEIDLVPLIKPVIEAAKVHYSLDALMPKVKSMKRLLPDTALRDALMREEPAAVSRKVSQAVSAFMSILSMQPPVQLLSAPGAFVAALNLPPDRLQLHLTLLSESVSCLEVAQRLAQQYTRAILAPSAEQLLTHAQEVGRLLNLTQDAATELLLRHPHLASTQHQLKHLSTLVQDVPGMFRLDSEQWQRMLTQRPELVLYSSTTALAAKYKAMAAVFPDASPLDVLEVCSYRAVIRAANTNSLVASLRTSAAIMGHDSPKPLLPLLLRQPAAYTDRPGASGSGRRQYAFLFQPAHKLAARAVQLQKLYGLSRTNLEQLARHFPNLVLVNDSATQRLKVMLLQVQLLGDGRLGQDDQVAPEMEKMIRACPQLTFLKHQTCLARISHLQTLLQLEQRQAAQMVLKLPQLLMYRTDKLASLFQGLSDLLGGPTQARALVLKDARVLLQLSRLRTAQGQLPVVTRLQQLLAGASQQATQHDQQQQQQLAVTNTVSHGGDEAAASGSAASSPAAALAGLRAAVQAVAAAAASAAERHDLLPVPDRPCRFRGVRQARHTWEMRYAGRSIYFPTELQAACAYDLARLAAGKGMRSGLNLPAVLYGDEQVQAVATYLQVLRQRQLQLQGQHTHSSQDVPVDDAPSEAHTTSRLQLKGEQLSQTEQREQQQQPDEEEQDGKPAGTATAQPTAGLQDLLVVQLLRCRAGRVLLGLSPDAAHARLETLASITGTSVQDLLQRLLRGASSHYNTVLQLSPARMQWNAASLQQQLQLPHASLQELLRKAPSLLQFVGSTMAQKTTALQAAFERCCDVAGVTGGGGGGGTGGLHCLQQAAMQTPEVLLLSSDKVAQRLQVLQDVCCTHEELRLQLRNALEHGAIGRWLIAGDAHFNTLQELAAGSPLLPQLKLSAYMRTPRAQLGTT